MCQMLFFYSVDLCIQKSAKSNTWPGSGRCSLYSFSEGNIKQFISCCNSNSHLAVFISVWKMVKWWSLADDSWWNFPSCFVLVLWDHKLLGEGAAIFLVCVFKALGKLQKIWSPHPDTHSHGQKIAQRKQVNNIAYKQLWFITYKDSYESDLRSYVTVMKLISSTALSSHYKGVYIMFVWNYEHIQHKGSIICRNLK